MHSTATNLTTAIFYATILSIPRVSLSDDLIFGSPAPAFSGAILRGDPIDGITNGSIHVIEFAGTRCVPCIKFIPEMNALQEQYPSVIFVSVFCESLDAVEPFMAGTGKAMRVRVATDETGSMRKEWLDAAGLQAIPQAFIVDRDGTLAWFGYPGKTELGKILKSVVQGNYDGRLEFMRMELNRQKEEKRREVLRLMDKLNDLNVRAHSCATPQESIALIDKAMPQFADSPYRTSLSTIKLGFYKTLPQSRERAYQHALSLAVEAIEERNPNFYVAACKSMLSHYEFASPENRDARLADLALAVLLDETAPENHSKLSKDGEADYQVRRLEAIANAHRLRGEMPEALEELRKAIALSLQWDLENKPASWIDKHKKTLSRLESMLTAWEN